MSVLQAQDIKKYFKQAEEIVEVLRGVTARFEQGVSYAITGPSGSGKSTLIHMLAGLDTPDAGSVLFDGQDITKFTPKQRRTFLNANIGLVFQLPYLIRELSVLENVMLKKLIDGKSAAECEAEACELLKKIGLEHKIYHDPFSLSGGEQQRVAIARAIFNKPAFLLADEPTGNLDVQTGNKIVDLLLNCQKEWGLGIIVSSHDEYVAKRMGSILHLKDGLLS